jgi:hypothetical protein
MKPLFVFCADTHLADGAWTTRPGIYGDAYYSFQQIIDYCIAQKLPLILGGDVLEKKSNSARPIAKLCEGLTQMQDARVPVYYIQGNHEYDRNAPWLSVHPWPVHLHEQCVPFGDKNGPRVYGLDWLPRGEIQEAFKRVPEDAAILITHQVWHDFMKNVGRPECALTDVHHAKIVLAGDFHVTETVTGVNAQNQPVTMFSPGSTCMQDISEAADKYFFVISQLDDGSFYCDNRQLQTRKFASYTVKDSDTLDELCAGKLAGQISLLVAGASEPIAKPLIRVKFDKRLPDAYLRIATAVGEQAHLFCDAIVDKSRGETETNRAVTRNDLITVVGELLKDKPAALKLALALLQSENAGAELEQQFEQFQQQQEQLDAVTAA